ncbi:MAG: trehalase-like protein [Bacteroidia bacterium]
MSDTFHRNYQLTDEELFDKARSILYENMIKGKIDVSGRNYHYTRPSPSRYPFQFFWDTCFHVFILTALGEYDMAKEHIISLFAMQRENGFVGHMIYWDRIKPGRITDIFQARPKFVNFFQSHMSELVQPPFVAHAVERIYQDSDDKDFLKDMLPKLKKYYRWLAENRDFDGDKLITIISPFESGMDWKPTYDVAMGRPERKADWRLFSKVVWVDFRNYINNYDLEKIYKQEYFLVKDVGFNTIYAQNLQALARLCRIGDDEEALQFDSLADEVISSLVDIMYDKEDEAFYDVFGKSNKKIRVLTPTIFYPIVLKEIPESITSSVLERHFFNSHEFDSPYKIPSVSISHPSFNPKESLYIWRGPVWTINNWFMHQYLLDKGHAVEADRLIKDIRSLIEKSGFREYYDPFTGEGYGARDFTWAALIVDMIKTQEKKTSQK